MPTDTFPIASDTDDGYCRFSNATATWPVTNAMTFADEPFGADIMSVSKTSTGGNMWVMNGLLRFDTSTLPGNASISGANLLLYLIDDGNPDGVSWAADYYDFGGSPCVAGDWELTSSGNAISAFPLSGLTTSTVNTIALTTLTGISVSGVTGIRIAPSSSASAPTGDNFTDFASRESVAGQEPRLEVTYTIPTQTLRPDADIVTTGWATAPLFSKINESSPDGTVITATAS